MAAKKTRKKKKQRAKPSRTQAKRKPSPPRSVRKGAPQKAAPRATARKPAQRATARARAQNVDAYINAQPAPLMALCMRVLSLVADAAPDASLGIIGGQPVWERNGPFAWMRADKEYVSLGFWRGASLDDPQALLLALAGGVGGDDEPLRHIKLSPDGDFPVEPLRRLVHEAVAQNALRGDPTKSRA